MIPIMRKMNLINVHFGTYLGNLISSLHAMETGISSGSYGQLGS